MTFGQFLPNVSGNKTNFKPEEQDLFVPKPQHKEIEQFQYP